MIASGYVLPPLGLYLMWRYRDWPTSLKSAVTVIGLALAGISIYISSTYIMPNVF
jgi:hypothetical protein